MAKVRVKAEFHDVNNYAVVYRVGNIYDFVDEARVANIVRLGLGEIVAEKPEAKPEPKAEQPKEEKPEVAKAEAEAKPEAAPAQKKRSTKKKK